MTTSSDSALPPRAATVDGPAEGFRPALAGRLELDEQAPELPSELDRWISVARAIGVETDELTVDELCQAIVDWVERIRSRENTGFGFVGSQEWENWGLGVEDNGHWHLFHFSRRSGSWIRHSHVSLRIPFGMPEGIARAFVAGQGRLSLPDAHSVWKRHATGLTSLAGTLDALKPSVSRLRKALKAVVHKEGHFPLGTPITWVNSQECWQARIKFGLASRAERRGVGFQALY